MMIKALQVSSTSLSVCVHAPDNWIEFSVVVATSEKNITPLRISFNDMNLISMN